MATAASTTPDFVRTPNSVGSTLDVQPYIDSIKSGSTLPDVTADPSLVIAQLARKVVHLEQHVSALQAKVASLTSSAAASTQLHEEASRLRHTLDAHRAALTQERTAPPPRHMESTFTMQALREWEQDHPTPHPTPGQGCALPPWVHDLQAAAATQRSRIAELELRVALAEASSPTALAVAPGPGSATRDVIPYAWRVAAAASAGVKNAGDTVPPVEFMQQLTQVLDEGKVGIFESPTGTGKTMSLICGLMTWLRKFNATFHEASDVPSTAEGVEAATAEAADEPSWLSSFSVHTSASMLAQRKAVWAKSRQRFLKRLARLSARANLAALTASRSEAAVSSVSGIGGGKRGRSVPKSLTASPAGQPDFTLWDAEPKEAAGPAAGAGLKARLVADALRAERSDSDGSTDAAPTPVPALPGAYRPVQIVFASRTHSQLSQFVAELRATKWGADARVVMLGGRRHLCCYAPVRSLGSDVEMTEACLRLRDAGRRSTARQAVMAKRKHIPLTSAPGEAGLSAEETALRLGSAVDAAGREVSASSALAAAAMRGAALTGSRCPANVPEGIELMRNHLLSRPLDIEEAAAGGMEAGVCAYYAARKALPLAEVVALPYNLLLSAPSRQALGLDLTGSVVVIDEAHNIINSVIDVHSVTLPHSTLQAACGQLEAYLAKYRTRLAARNRQQCTLLLKLAKGLDKAMHSMQQQGSPLPPGLSAQRAGPNKYLQGSVSAFVAWAGVEEVNAHALLRWTHESGVCNKLRGFTEAAAAAAGDRPASATASQRLVSLLEAWAASDQNGSMFLVQPGQGEAYLRYTLLNAAAPMAGILREARSVVMAGGTMKPVEEVVAALLPSVPRDRLVTFSCGHVIPPSALTVATLPRGPRGIPLNFTHARRRNGDMLVDFGAAIVNAARALPGGLALFVPSYDFIDLLLGPDGAWGSAGAVQADAAGGEGVPGALAAGPPGSILARLQASKAVFLERRGGATREGGASPSLWASYAACIASGRGAVLVCVMGGKLSEGINFKDDLARTVVVAGLPYATPHDPELVARMAFFDALRPGGGREYYENLCMKAVNQSIGRVIRHAGDHGVVLLADERYNKPAVQARLPEWIQPRSHTCHSFGEAFKTVVSASRGATSTSGGGQQG